VRSEKSGYTWAEETVTDLLLVESSPEVRAFQFNKRQEGGKRGTGADWLWWWIGDGGESFGALVQAKRLHKERDGRWKLDFDYKEGKQRALLMSAARALQVAPTYALYMGSPNYRSPIDCGWPHNSSDFQRCERCIRKTISLLPALLLTNGGIRNDPVRAYQLASPLEDLADPNVPVSAGPMHLSADMGEELVRFLLTQYRSGPRKVAKALVGQIRWARAGQFGLMTAEPLETRGEDFAFQKLPDDHGHWGEAYYPNVLRGLRNSPPGYVLELRSHDGPEVPFDVPFDPEELNLAGVVLVDAASA
jgi:hypothetical protein